MDLIVGYLKIDDNAGDHPKLAGLTDTAFRVWFRGCCYAARLCTDGFIPSAMVEAWTRRPAAIVRELERAVLWHTVAGGYQIHDFLDWNDSAEVRRQRTAAKADRQTRWKTRRRGGDASPERHQRRVGDAPPTPTPTPTPTPSDYSVVGARVARGAPGSPLDFHRKHGPHVTGFCDWVCLPKTLVSELAGKAQQTDDEVIAWARGVREAWQGPVDEPDCFRFWRDRYRDDMRRPTPPAATRANVTEHMATADYHAARQAARSVS